jgi:signal transduction histidine kinase
VHFRGEWICSLSRQLLLYLGAMAVCCSAALAQITQTPLAQSHTAVALQTVLLQDMAEPDSGSLLPLPVLLYREKRELRYFRATSEFDLPAWRIDQRWLVYFLSLNEGGRIWVNGHEVGDVPTTTPDTTVRNVRPYTFYVPATYLKSKNNILQMEWAARETQLTVPRIFVGPSDEVEPHYRKRLFWQNTMAQAAFVFSLIITMLMLGIYSQQRSNYLYLLLGLSSMGWSVLNLGYFLPPMPQWIFPYWRFFFYLMIGFFACAGWLYMLFESKNYSRLYAKGVAAWGVLGPLGYLAHYLLTGKTFFFWVEGIWAMGNAVLGIYPLFCMARIYYRQRKARHLIYLLAAACALVVGLSDVLTQIGRSMFGGVGHSLQAVAPIWFISVCLVLISDFVKSFRAQEEQRLLLDLKLDEQQRELARLYDKDRLLEREKAAGEERQRIMQDMHDGLGSQLISSLELTERGELTQEQTSLLIRECIDDLRLAIDTLTEDDNEFAVAAGNLRFRMEPRLRAAGITLRWNTRDLPDALTLSAEHVLPLLRVLQESMTNTLKHAQAKEIRVRIAANTEALTIEIHDDGKGFDRKIVRGGKGLTGIEKRARKLGAKVEITGHAGTTVLLTMPLRMD